VAILSEFGEPFYIELIGNGTVGLSFEEWGNCYRLARAFGWLPAGTVAPAANTRWAQTEGLTAEWDGNYFSNDQQQVADDDSKALSAALQTAVMAWDRVEELTMQEFDALRRVPRAFDSYVTRVADYAAKGGFLLY
jgi:hypothetical protein